MLQHEEEEPMDIIGRLSRPMTPDVGRATEAGMDIGISPAQVADGRFDDTCARPPPHNSLFLSFLLSFPVGVLRSFRGLHAPMDVAQGYSGHGGRLDPGAGHGRGRGLCDPARGGHGHPRHPHPRPPERAARRLAHPPDQQYARALRIISLFIIIVFLCVLIFFFFCLLSVERPGLARIPPPEAIGESPKRGEKRKRVTADARGTTLSAEYALYPLLIY
jgi:hypothetical protein